MKKLLCWLVGHRWPAPPVTTYTPAVEWILFKLSSQCERCGMDYLDRFGR